MLSEALRKNASTKTGGDGGATLLKFDGVDGMRVCNASAPFLFQGKQHLFATVLSGDGSAQVAGVRLFVKTSHASYEVVPHHATYQLTRPFVARIHDELVFAGLKVIYDKSQPCERYCDIYRGTPDRVHYYSSGENNYQAFCAVPLASPAKAFAIFGHTRNGTNPRTITCTTCTDLNDISAASFKAARPIGDADFQQVPGEVRQAFLLEDSMVGCLATHICPTKGATVVTTFVYNPTTNGVEDVCVLPTPDVPPPTKAECVKDELFLSGMVYREDGMCDVFLGLNYSTEVCITVKYPFAKHGKIASPLTF